ncbi:MAG: ATP-binding protein [Acidobacteriota bacterium]
MSHLNVLVVVTAPDTKAAVIAECVAARSDMTLLGGRITTVDEVDAILADSSLVHVAAVVVGDSTVTRGMAERWVAARADIVAMLVDLVDDVIRIQGITLRDPRLDALLTTLHDIFDRVGPEATDRVVRVDLGAPSGDELVTPEVQASPGRPLLDAAINWLHHLLRDAVARVPSDNGDVHGLSVTKTTLLQALEAPLLRTPDDGVAGADEASRVLDAVRAAAFEHPDEHCEPLAVALRAFKLRPVELRLLVLALAPEVDFRFQRCFGFLLDEMGRRVGTFALYAALLDANATLRDDLAGSRSLDRWLVFDAPLGQRPPADEALRVDPFLARWLLGESRALDDDPRLRRVMRPDPWPGAALLSRRDDRSRADELLRQLPRGGKTQWLVLNGADPAGWRALVELGASAAHATPIRVEAARLHGLDLIDIDDTARRLVRNALCTGRPLVVDTVKAESLEGHDEWLARFVGSLSRAGGRVVAICADEASAVTDIGAVPFALGHEEALSREARAAAMRRAAEGADVFLSSHAAAAMANRFPLHVDALEEAMRLAQSRPLDYRQDDPRLARFTTACKALSARGLSHLAGRLDPTVDLDDLVLPADRKNQLIEIIDNVRLAHVVLDDWKFGERLPYGRGVTALFYGASGTGKTMGAMAVARRLDIEMLHLDLSRVVSKFIGDTEKHIDRVFSDAERTGAVILIDEADALFGKRSEVKDAHDRFANIEVAFILMRLDAFSGLAILTSNMRQSLDPAFIRRLRFIVEFPKPDVGAREQIWRQCLPPGTYTIADAVFRQLARKVDVTGGHIRQITLRAAFLAAAAGTLIGVEHIVQATRAELAKLGLPAIDLDLGKVKAA